jgi:hypothetical protein
MIIRVAVCLTPEREVIFRSQKDRKLQFAKALISLKLKFWRLGFKHNLIRSLTFSHNLGQSETKCSCQTKSAVPLHADQLSEKSGHCRLKVRSATMSGQAAARA